MDIDEKLIEEVRNRAILYDLGKPDYKNLKKKEHVWREVAANLKLNDVECKKRRKGLRDSYKRCKRLQQIASGSGAKTLKRKWRYYDSMSFLDDVTSSRRTVGNICSDDDFVEMSDFDEAEGLTPASQTSMLSRGKRFECQDDSEKFQEFLDYATSSIADIGGAVVCQRQEQNSTAMHFASLAAKINEAGMPPSVVNSIESEVSILVFTEIKKYHTNINEG